jgi:predicted transcriptional regulator
MTDHLPTVERMLNKLESLIRAGLKNKPQLHRVTNLPYYKLDEVLEVLKHEGRIKEVSPDTYKAVTQVKLKARKQGGS